MMNEIETYFARQNRNHRREAWGKVSEKIGQPKAEPITTRPPKKEAEAKEEDIQSEEEPKSAKLWMDFAKRLTCELNNL